MYSDERSVQRESAIYKVTGRTLEDCKDELHKKFGRDYQIVDKRNILVGGFLGLGQKEMLEVSYKILTPEESENSFANVRKEKMNDTLAAFKKNQEAMANALMSTQIANLTSKFNEMQNSLSSKIESIASAASSAGEKHPTIKKIEDLLSANEFSYSYINEMCDRIKQTFSLDTLDDFEKVERTVVDWIGESISIAKEKQTPPPHIVVIVGPTGVGKTTTLAKIATKKVLDAKDAGYKKPEFSFVTIDSMRVGSYEQLERFSDVFGTQVEKAETVDDLKKIFNERKDSVDAMFIDTSGFSPNDSKHIGEMKALFEIRGFHPDVFLAVTASTKARDLINIMQNYELFNYNSVIITKWDESHEYGNIISALNEKNKKISYITDGQKVARDFHKASVVEFLKNLSGFSIDGTHIEDVFGE